MQKTSCKSLLETMDVKAANNIFCRKTFDETIYIRSLLRIVSQATGI